MSQYRIFFYVNKKDTYPKYDYYREFDTHDELIEWCKATLRECNWYKFRGKTISLSEFLKHTQQ